VTALQHFAKGHVARVGDRGAETPPDCLTKIFWRESISGVPRLLKEFKKRR